MLSVLAHGINRLLTNRCGFWLSKLMLHIPTTDAEFRKIFNFVFVVNFKSYFFFAFWLHREYSTRKMFHSHIKYRWTRWLLNACFRITKLMHIFYEKNHTKNNILHYINISNNTKERIDINFNAEVFVWKNQNAVSGVSC